MSLTWFIGDNFSLVVSTVKIRMSFISKNYSNVTNNKIHDYLHDLFIQLIGIYLAYQVHTCTYLKIKVLLSLCY